MLQMNQVDSASQLANLAYRFYGKSEELQGILSNVELLLATSIAKDDDAALKWSMLRNELKDSLYSAENARILNQLSAEQEFLETKLQLEEQATTERLATEEEKRNNVLLMIGLVGLVIFSFIIIQIYERTRRNNQKLEKLNA